MNAHGNLKDQVRDYGPFPGIQTAPESDAAEVAAPTNVIPEQALISNGCTGVSQAGGAISRPEF